MVKCVENDQSIATNMSLHQGHWNFEMQLLTGVSKYHQNSMLSIKSSNKKEHGYITIIRGAVAG